MVFNWLASRFCVRKMRAINASAELAKSCPFPPTLFLFFFLLRGVAEEALLLSNLHLLEFYALAQKGQKWGKKREGKENLAEASLLLSSFHFGTRLPLWCKREANERRVPLISFLHQNRLSATTDWLVIFLLYLKSRSWDTAQNEKQWKWQLQVYASSQIALKGKTRFSMYGCYFCICFCINNHNVYEY